MLLSAQLFNAVASQGPPAFVVVGAALAVAAVVASAAPVAVEAVVAPIVTWGVALPDDTTPNLRA